MGVPGPVPRRERTALRHLRPARQRPFGHAVDRIRLRHPGRRPRRPARPPRPEGRRAGRLRGGRRGVRAVPLPVRRPTRLGPRPGRLDHPVPAARPGQPRRARPRPLRAGRTGHQDRPGRLALRADLAVLRGPRTGPGEPADLPAAGELAGRHVPEHLAESRHRDLPHADDHRPARADGRGAGAHPGDPRDRRPGRPLSAVRPAHRRTDPAQQAHHLRGRGARAVRHPRGPPERRSAGLRQGVRPRPSRTTRVRPPKKGGRTCAFPGPRPAPAPRQRGVSPVTGHLGTVEIAATPGHTSPVLRCRPTKEYASWQTPQPRPPPGHSSWATPHPAATRPNWSRKCASCAPPTWSGPRST
ncbi:hypothetical protein SGPA1_10974 [Streptomyces misionensis JCM 4497]